MRNGINVSCTWGDGPDVMVSFENHPFILYEDPKNDAPPKGKWKHGYVTMGSFDMSADEAETLAYLLRDAARKARALEKGYEA